MACWSSCMVCVMMSHILKVNRTHIYSIYIRECVFHNCYVHLFVDICAPADQSHTLDFFYFFYFRLGTLWFFKSMRMKRSYELILYKYLITYLNHWMRPEQCLMLHAVATLPSTVFSIFATSLQTYQWRQPLAPECMHLPEISVKFRRHWIYKCVEPERWAISCVVPPSSPHWWPSLSLSAFSLLTKWSKLLLALVFVALSRRHQMYQLSDHSL